MIPRELSVTCIVWTFIMVAGGCVLVSNRRSEPKAVFIETPEYRQKVNDFRYDFEAATDLLKEFLINKPELEGMVWIHYIVVDDEYLYSSGESKLGISLDGVYVDGHTGAIKRVRSPAQIYWSDHQDWDPDVRKVVRIVED